MYTINNFDEVAQSYGYFFILIKRHDKDESPICKSRSERIQTPFSVTTTNPDELDVIHRSKYRCCSNGDCSVYFSLVSKSENPTTCLKCKHEFKNTDVNSRKNQDMFGNLTCSLCNTKKSQLYGEFIPVPDSNNKIIHYFICDDCIGVK